MTILITYESGEVRVEHADLIEIDNRQYEETLTLRDRDERLLALPGVIKIEVIR